MKRTLLDISEDRKFATIELTIGTYRFRRLIFMLGILVLLLYFGVTVFLYGFKNDQLYVACNAKLGGLCENPLYHNYKYCGVNIDSSAPVCTLEFLQPGFVYGTPPPFLVKHFGLFVFLSLSGLFILNHVLYNRGMNWKGGLE